VRRIVPLLLAALAAAPPLAAFADVDKRAPTAPTPEKQGAHFEPVRAALALLLDEDVEGAKRILEPLLAQAPDDEDLLLVGGILRFYEQRYDDAVLMLEEVAGEEDPGGYLALAKGTRDVVKRFARFESDHFVVVHPKGKDEVLVPYALEALEAQRAALAKDLGWSPEGKVTVEFLNGVSELATLSTLSEAEIRTSGTIAVCKFNKLMVVSPKALLKGYDWLDTIAHEYAHHVITRRTKNRTPIWLHEGLAKWSESRWRGAGGQSFSPVSAALLKEALRKDELVTFEQMHPSMAKLPSQHAAALAFAEVVMAVEYLVKQGGTALVNRVLDGVAAGKAADRAVADAVGVPFEKFVAGWKKHMAERPLPKGGDHELRRLRFKDDPKTGGPWTEWAEIPDGKAREFARLGEIMRERGRWAAARVEYGKAIARVGTRFPILADQFALSAMMSGAEREAERVLVEAVDWNPEYAALHVHLARLLVKREDWKRAKEHLLLANRQDPFDPEIHAGLSRALEALGDPGGASREKRFAQLLSGGAE
jgi:tetratricopeptide (TPR) repeat protein